MPIDVHVEETYTAEGYDANGNLLPNEKVKWSILEEIDGISIVEDTGALTVTSAVYNTGITSFTPEETALRVEETAQLTAQIEPEDATNKNVTGHQAIPA